MVGFLIAMAIIGGLASLAGTAIQTAGAVRQTKAAADKAELDAEVARVQAENLEELSQEGGYYDQVLAGLQLELDDIEADKAAAATTLALTEQELSAGKAQSELEQKVAVAGLEGQKEASKIQEKVQVTGAVMQGLEAGEAGAQARGTIAARAGAGNVGGMSILRQAESVTRQVGRRVSYANMQARAAKQQGAIERAGIEGQIGVVQGAGELERLRMTNEATRARLQYEDTLRGLDVSAQTAAAQQTRTLFEQSSGLEEAGLYEQQAGLLTEEADWLKTYGVPLTYVGGLVQGVGDLASMGTAIVRAKGK